MSLEKFLDSVAFYNPQLTLMRLGWQQSPISKNLVYSEAVRLAYMEVDCKIEKASTAECLLSPSKYVRECKKWYINNGR